MGKAKKAPKKAPKKATKRASASTSALDAHRERHKREREHVGGKLRVAHSAVLSIVDKVHADDSEGLARLRRAVDHATDNAQSRGKVR